MVVTKDVERADTEGVTLRQQEKESNAFTGNL